MKAYDHRKIEKKWQEFWAKNKIYTTPDQTPGRDNFYLLVEFPYPSGNLHVGHWYAFAIPDILSRALRMQGKNVLYPIGFDAFGLPAENAAIKNKLNPREWTEQNIAHMTKQIESMGTSFDWSRKVSTIDPSYYKWTQWLFLQLYKKGLVYQKETAVNWCPQDKTVLANEQVVDGKCERCGHEVVQRQMLQWNIKITDYADRLIDDLAPLDWPEQIKESQRNWIGRSEGAEIDFYLDFKDPEINERIGADSKKAHITVFTTRPDTLFGATYLVLAPEHLWVTLALQHKTVLKNNDEVQKYVDQANKKTELERQTETKEKTGVKLEGVEAINPATGEKIPLYVADYVLGHYGTGAIMAVPAHDERDFEFAKKFDLPIRDVISKSFVMSGEDGEREGVETLTRRIVDAVIKDKDDNFYLIKEKGHTHFVGGGVDGDEDDIAALKREIAEESGFVDIVIGRKITPEISCNGFRHTKGKNQRTTGPAYEVILNSDKRIPGEIEEGRHELIKLSKEKVLNAITWEHHRYLFERYLAPESPYTGTGLLTHSGEFDRLDSGEAKKKITEKFGRAKKTYRLRDWIVSRQRYWGVPIPIIHCEKCGVQPVPDAQLPVLLPEVEDYLPEGSGKSPLAKVKSFVEVRCPKCGGKAERETDTLDTFVDSSWYFLRYTDPQNANEFAAKDKQANWIPVDLYSGGAEHTTMHLLYSRFWHKALYDCGLVNEPEPYTRRMNRSIILGPDGQKMSKSRGNVIDPDEVVERLGADTVRLYLAFIGPYNEVASYPWNPDGVVGVRRFLERVWRLQEKVASASSANVESQLHRTIKKVGEDVEKLKFNTAISAMMIFVNVAEKEGITADQLAWFLRILAPFAPHLTEELWHEMGNDTSVHLEKWPSFDASLLQDEEITIAIQINGKTRDEIRIAADLGKEEIEKTAREKVASRLEGKKIARTIVVPGRLVNFVIS